jgi:hypothetical protein
MFGKPVAMHAKITWKLQNASLVSDSHIYYINFEINGVSCNLIDSQECDFTTNRTPSSAIHAEIAPSFNH